MSNAKNENVTVILTRDPSWPDGIKKEFQSNLGNGNRLTFKNNKHPGFRVNFVISDPDNTGYLFPQDIQKALWSKEIPDGSNECLTAPAYWDGFKAVGVSADFKTLTVSDPNRKKQRFTFTLRFTLDPIQGNCIDWDPIGNDQNGPRTKASFTTPIIGAGVGGALGIAAVFATNEVVATTTIAMGALIGAVAGFVIGLVTRNLGGGSLQSDTPA